MFEFPLADRSGKSLWVEVSSGAFSPCHRNPSSNSWGFSMRRGNLAFVDQLLDFYGGGPLLYWSILIAPPHTSHVWSLMGYGFPHIGIIAAPFNLRRILSSRSVASSSSNHSLCDGMIVSGSFRFCHLLKMSRSFGRREKPTNSTERSINHAMLAKISCRFVSMCRSFLDQSPE